MSAAKVEHAPAAPHAADGHAEKRRRSGAEKAMAFGIALGTIVTWPLAAMGAGVLATTTFVAGSVLAIGGMVASAFRKV